MSTLCEYLHIQVILFSPCFQEAATYPAQNERRWASWGITWKKREAITAKGVNSKEHRPQCMECFHILIANQRVNEYPGIHFLSRHLGKITNLLQTRLPALQFPHFQMISQADTYVVKRRVTRAFVIWVQTAEFKMSFSRQSCTYLYSFLMIPGTCSSYTQFSDWPCLACIIF